MVEDAINTAKVLHHRYGAAMSKDKDLMDLLRRYHKAIRDTHATMREVGVLSSCACCAGEKPGGCCFEGVEEWYDHVLLLVNLMLDRDIHVSRETPGGCIFVGSRGCKLVARHSFCINYLCPNLQTALTAFQKKALLFVTGVELFKGWELEQRIHRWLRFA